MPKGLVDQHQKFNHEYIAMISHYCKSFAHCKVTPYNICYYHMYANA